MTNRYKNAFDIMQGGSIESQNDRGYLEEGYEQSPNLYEGSPEIEPTPEASSDANNIKAASKGMAAMTASDKGGASKLGGGLMAAGAVPSPASPYLLAAGAGLSVIGGSIDAKKQREAQEVQNEMARRQRVMQLMGNLGSGFGGIG